MDLIDLNSYQAKQVFLVVSCKLPAEMKMKLIGVAASQGMNVNQFLAMVCKRAIDEAEKGQMNLFEKSVKPVKSVKPGKSVKSFKKRLDRKSENVLEFYGLGKVIDFMKRDGGVQVHGLKSKLSKMSRDNGSLDWHGWTIERLRSKYWVG